MIRKIPAAELKKTFSLSENIDLTVDVNSADKLLGQARAEKALTFGMQIKARGYNIYISGLPQTGKTSFAELYAKEAAKKEPVPPDLCYVYNFDNPKCPKLIKLNAGEGKIFAEGMEELVSILTIELQKIFASKEFEDDKNSIVKNYQDKRDIIVKEVQDKAKERNFGVKMTGSGIYFMPIVDGEIITEEQYDSLSDEDKEVISKASDIIQIHAYEVMRQIKEYEKETRREVEALEYNAALFCVGRYINKLAEKFNAYENVLSYLSHVKEDILENLEDFMEVDEENEEAIQNFMPWMSKKSADDLLSKYKVNLITDNSGLDCAPVIVDFKPTYAHLTGEVEYDSEYGNFTTDFMKIKPGLLHRANGGYLILQAYDILTNPHVWETLRQIIKTNEVVIEPLREYVTGIAVTSIKPEPVNINVKIILVGSQFYYDLLSEYDDEFLQFFKIHAVFDYEMPGSSQNEYSVAEFIKRYAKKEGLPDFDISAICRILEYASRLAERNDKLTAQLGKLTEIMHEAAAWHQIDSAEGAVNKTYIDKAITERDFRNSMYEEKLTEMIENNTVMIDTSGGKTAQINGLAVIDTGDYVFAKPSRITATTYVGKAGIINIEKEAEMSGSIHDKGVEVLTGYLGQKYAQEFPLSVSCRICFEQNYSGIDGDSASSTELYTILSSLADVPINQSLAVTGSINQRGEIQPIGGVTYKVEGFFDLCRQRGLTGQQGVIIPEQNIIDLTLKDDVIEAIAHEKFHIYAINHVDDGIELLTGIKAGIKSEKGKYPSDSIHGKVYKKLKEYYKKSIMEE